MSPRARSPFMEPIGYLHFACRMAVVNCVQVSHQYYPETTEGIIVGSNITKYFSPDTPWVAVLWHCWPTTAEPFTRLPLNGFSRLNTTSIASQLVSIQPMTLPVGQIFYIDYTYGSGSQDTSNIPSGTSSQ